MASASSLGFLLTSIQWIEHREEQETSIKISEQEDTITQELQSEHCMEDWLVRVFLRPPANFTILTPERSWNGLPQAK